MFARSLLKSILGMTVVAFSTAMGANAQQAGVFGSLGPVPNVRYLSIFERDVSAGRSITQTSSEAGLRNIIQSVVSGGESRTLQFLTILESDVQRVAQLEAALGLKAQAAENLQFLILVQSDIAACQQGHCAVSPF
jgi:hypothetical protein